MFVAVVLVSLLPIVSSYFGLGYKNIARVTNFHPEAFSNHIDASAAVLASRIRNKNTVNSPTVSSDTKAFPFVTNEQSPEVALPTNNLPWKESINPSRKLTYMSMFNHQLEIVKAMGMKEVSLEEHIVYRSSSVKPARIGNMCFQNEQFRKVRMTYFDAGDAVQVFNSVWYPSAEYDLPMLGIDLISLGKSRVLTVIDMQPLHPTEEYSKKYINHLSSIRSKYEDLQGVLSGKIYDDTSFFSKNMLFGRFTDESKVDTVVGPAFEEYLAEYLKLMANAKPNNNKDAKEVVINRQKEYDIYSAIKDPAVGLFDAYFGKEWSDSYVHDFLFSLSRQREPMELLLATKSEHTDNKAVHSFKIDQTTGEVSIGSNVTNNSNSSH